MKKKLLAMVLVAALVVSTFLIVACGNDTADSPPAANDVDTATDDATTDDPSEPEEAGGNLTGTFTAWVPFGSEVDNFGAYLQAFGDLHPDLNFDFSFGDDYRNQIRMAITAGEAPDIIFVYAGETFMEFIDFGIGMDLTDIVIERGFRERVYEDHFDNFTVDGRLYGMPVGGVTVWGALYANMDILNERGLEIPQTMDELFAMSEILRADNIQTLAIGVESGFPITLFLGDLFYQLAPFSEVEALVSGETRFVDSAPMRQALETVARLGTEGVFIDGFGNMGIGEATWFWADGGAAFHYLGSWWTGVTDGRSDFGFEIQPIWIPLMEGVSDRVAVQMSADNAMMININTENVEAAIAFMDYFTSREAQTIYCEENNIFSIYPGLNRELNFDPIFMEPAIQDQFDYPFTGVFFDNAFPFALRGLMITNTTEVALGMMTVDEALEAWDRELAR